MIKRDDIKFMSSDIPATNDLNEYFVQKPGEIYLKIIGKANSEEELIEALEDIVNQLKSRKHLIPCQNLNLKAYVKS